MKVVFTEPAEADLEEIGDWIAQRNPTRAMSFAQELREACLGIGERASSYPLVRLRESDGIRRRVYGNYLIFYRVMLDAVEILHVLHGARDYEGLIFPEDER
ncbi:MAG TPA: type II toxin-antitoxin system RelE/ParE family toxin [Reyranella sp.]|nr:type II toxin-antitoxin system RelE/ParE family toxin [Reyranella sp.]